VGKRPAGAVVRVDGREGPVLAGAPHRRAEPEVVVVGHGQDVRLGVVGDQRYDRGELLLMDGRGVEHVYGAGPVNASGSQQIAVVS
jgi:hypothetical protein